MQTLKLKDGSSALVVIAHPDDETIWLGGTIMKHPHLQWTVFSLCRASDTDRAPKFVKVCHQLKAKSIITDLEDDDQMTIKETVPIIKQLLQDNIKEKFDYIFTHGANGEYGHPRHLGVHQAVTAMLNNQLLSAKVGFYLNYKKDDEQAEFSTLSPQDDSDYIIKLTDKELNNKKKIMSDIYGYAPDGIDTSYCTKTEGFKIIKTII